MTEQHICTVCFQASEVHRETCDCGQAHFPALCCKGCDCGSYEDAHATTVLDAAVSPPRQFDETRAERTLANAGFRPCPSCGNMVNTQADRLLAKLVTAAREEIAARELFKRVTRTPDQKVYDTAKENLRAVEARVSECIVEYDRTQERTPTAYGPRSESVRAQQEPLRDALQELTTNERARDAQPELRGKTP